MTTTQRVTRSRSRSLPAIYPAIALAVAAILLPSALRPPPEQTNDSAALNPNAPPDDNSEQVIQAFKQAQGGGAGAAEVEGPPVTAPEEHPPASGTCFGDPPRQTESVYSAACAPAFSGDNGGATAKNVFPNEVRLGFWHTIGSPPEGRIPDNAQPGESANTRTFRVLQAYFNKRFQTWGRKIVFYALSGSTDPSADIAEAKKADEQYHLFGASHLNLPFCQTFARDTGPSFCNPEQGDVYDANRPNFYSFMIDRTAAAGFGAEFMCKKLLNKPAQFSGTENGKMRKIAVVTDKGPSGGEAPSLYSDALSKECGGSFSGGSYQLNNGNDAGGATGAVTQMRTAGVTTVLIGTQLVDTLYLMAAAAAVNWQPEWVLINAYGLDFNLIGTVLPQTEASHLFGLSAWEVPQRFEQTECYAAYKSIDPDNDPDASDCQLFWHTMLMLVDGIQQAGPKLTPESFEQGLFKMGHRFPSEPWAIGGGFGPGDYSYMDNVGEVWYSLNAQNPENGNPGAYVWSYAAKRFKRGELPSDTDQLFHHGVTTPGGPDQAR